MTDDVPPPERPRSEPEIIPPDRSGRRSDWQRSPWHSELFETRGTHRVYVGRIGPFGIALLILAIAAFLAIVMIAVVGAVLIWIPVVAVLVLAAGLFRLLRR